MIALSHHRGGNRRKGGTVTLKEIWKTQGGEKFRIFVRFERESCADTREVVSRSWMKKKENYDQTVQEKIEGFKNSSNLGRMTQWKSWVTCQKRDRENRATG